MEQNVGRREFVASAAMAAGAVMTATATSRAYADEMDEAAEEEATESESDSSGIAWDEEFDVIVVGSGTAAYAALEARDEGAESVAVIEKSVAFGGTSSNADGAFWFPNNNMMVEAGYEDSREDAITYIKANAEGQTTDAIVEAFVDASPKFVDWANESLGIEWVFTSTGSYTEYTDLEGYHSPGRTIGSLTSSVSQVDTSNYSGAGVMWAFIREAIDNDNAIDLKLSTEAKHLLTNDEGRVIGVQCELEDGSTTNYKAHYGVILGTGGFDHNAEWRKQFLRTPIYNTQAVATDTGDGHRMGLEVGAALGNMQNIWGIAATIPPADVPEGDALYDGSVFYNDLSIISDLPGRRTKPNCIVVNKAGERFANESASYHHFNRAFEGWDASTFTMRNIPAYFICDSTFVNYYCLPGTTRDAEVGEIPDGTVICDTIEELADELGIDYGGLSKTIEEFNECAEEGYDPVFERGEHFFDTSSGADTTTGRTDLVNPCLGPVETPPFYAYAYLPGTLGTSGGLVINEKARVLNISGEEIPGLYACGNCSAGIFGSGYPAAGSTLSAGAVMGWIAARDAMTLEAIE